MSDAPDPAADPAAEWERLATVARAMAVRCTGAAHVVRTTPRSTGSLRERELEEYLRSVGKITAI